MDKRCVDIDDVLDLFGISDEDIYGKGTIEDALYDGTLKVYKLPSAQPEVTEEEVKEYCRKRCLSIVDSALLEKYASAQPEIIRCKDCAHYNAGFECLIEGYGIERNADWFCADAERRTDG